MSDVAGSDAFLGALDVDRRERFARCVELGALLDEGLRQAREQWPELDVDTTALLRFVAARAPEVPERIAELRWGDLCLACAVAAGDSTAAAALRERCHPKLRAALASIGLGDATEEVAQQVFSELVLPDARGRRGIEGYRGTGDLAAFVKVIAVRNARRGAKKQGRERPVDPATLLEAASGAVDPELQVLKLKYREEFKEAFHVALGALSQRERTILRYELVGGLNIDQIGALYDAHRATIARWRAAARDKLFQGTLASMKAKLGVGATEFQSIVRLIGSELEVSLHRVLSEDAEGA
jgi:RNA polymerase sigma-70 factor, ECF subfamily